MAHGPWDKRRLCAFYDLVTEYNYILDFIIIAIRGAQLINFPNSFSRLFSAWFSEAWTYSLQFSCITSGFWELICIMKRFEALTPDFIGLITIVYEPPQFFMKIFNTVLFSIYSSLWGQIIIWTYDKWIHFNWKRKITNKSKLTKTIIFTQLQTWDPLITKGAKM